MELMQLREMMHNNTINDFPEITKEYANNAYLASLIKIKNRYDVFYYFASMNLLNAYVKKADASEEFIKRYRFKNYVVKGIEEVLHNEGEGINIYFTTKVAYISVMGFQFSFHNLNSTCAIDKYINSTRNIEQEWSGLKLQPPTALIYKVAKDMYKNRKF